VNTTTAPSPVRGAAEAVPRPAARPWPAWTISTTGLLSLLLVWSLVAATGWVDPVYLPSPQSLGQELWTLLQSGYKGASLWQHIGISLFRTLSGFAIGVLLGVPLGLVTGHSRAGAALVSPLMAFIRPIPPIAFIPMAVLYFGLGELGKIVLIAFTSFNYMQINAHAGAAGVPQRYLRAAQSLGLSPHQVFVRVVLPHAVPQLFTGFKVAMALSWAVVVAAELVGAQRGLGFMISDAAQLFRIPVVFIGIALIGCIGLALNTLIDRLERRVVHWHKH
jgi:ABC-type nitrate/sulfonate/bicarbonate transport system permease component